MKDATYSLIRYVPDPARGEALNIGILVWDDASFRLGLEDRAINRVIVENPWLATDALAGLEGTLSEQLASEFSNEPANIAQSLGDHRYWPVCFTEPRFTTIMDESSGLQEPLDRLLARIVRPRRRSGGSASLRDQVERRLKAFIRQNTVHKNHEFTQTRSGTKWAAQFFANSGTNLAFDTIKLDLARADAIRTRAASEAYKIYDVSTSTSIRYIVHLQAPTNPGLSPELRNARNMLESVGATVTTDLDEAVESFARSVATADYHG